MGIYVLQACESARGLIALGIEKGDTVLSIGVDGPDSAILFVAASIIGAIYTVSIEAKQIS